MKFFPQNPQMLHNYNYAPPPPLPVTRPAYVTMPWRSIIQTVGRQSYYI